MSVWLCIPSARKADEVNPVLAQWRLRGYRIAVFRDAGAEPVNADLQTFGKYPGWARATNGLCRMAAAYDPNADWFVCGGDDLHPEMTLPPDEIARQCGGNFAGTLGVMQAMGDKYGALDGQNQPACVSPWIGREWVQRAYRGCGPFHEGYYHFWSDAELWDVAYAAGRLWLRDDLLQYHDHWLRRRNLRPAHLEAAVAASDGDCQLYRKRKAANFPGSEPL